VLVGALDGGFGATHMNAFLSSLNIPVVKADTFKRYERVVGPAMEKVAEGSCQEAIQEEKTLTLAKESRDSSQSGPSSS